MWATGVRNPVESEKARKKFINEINDEVKLYDDIWPDKVANNRRHTRLLSKDVASEQHIICLYYVNENNVETCPQIPMLKGNQPCRALIDIGCQRSIISEGI